MSRLTLPFLVLASWLVISRMVYAQAVDPAGHWVGALQTPAGQMALELDLARNAKGEWVGTINLPDEQLKGLPLQAVVVNGNQLALHARRDQPMAAVVSPDGTSIEGRLNTSDGAAPFRLKRTGDAVIEAPLTSDAIARDLEGLWTASLTTRQGEMQLALNLANQPDGTGLARLINLTQGGLVIPVRFVQKASDVALEIKVVALSFNGSLNAARNELTGTLRQGVTSVPVTFKKAGSDRR